VQNSTGMTVTNNARVQPAVSGATYANVPLTLSGHGDLGNNHFGAWYVNDNNGSFSWPGAITLAGDATIGSFGTANTNTFGGVIGGGGGLRFWAGGAHNEHTHQYVLAAANSYSGNTTIEATWAANCEVKLTTGNNRLPTGTVLTMNASSGWGGLYTKLLLNGRNQTLGGLTTGGGGGTNRIVNGSATAVTLTISNSVDYTYGGSLGGPGANEDNFNLTKAGAGTLILSGQNSYAGTTTINGGTLQVNGVTGNGAVNVMDGVLGGTGVIRGPVTVQASGTLSPGGSIGTLSVSNTLTLTAASMTLIEVNAQTGASDRVDGITTATYGGTLAVTNVAGTLTAGQSFPLFSANSANGSFDIITPATPGPGLAWEFNPTTGTLLVVATQPPQFTQFSVSGGAFTMSGTGPAGSSYRIYAATNMALSFSEWTPVATGAFSGGMFSFTDEQATNYPVRFYRAVSP
jgi:autotransporter-associated beta strand protein